MASAWKTIDCPAGRFAYRSRGEPTAPLLLFLHGFPDQPRGFDATMSFFDASEFFCVAPWMRGYSPSVLDGPYDPERLARDAIAIADALSPDRPARIVGHDWGAVATYAAIALAPERFHAAVTMAVPHPFAFARNVARHPRQLVRSWYMLFFQLRFVAERIVAARNFALIDRLWRDWSPGWSPPGQYMAEVKDCLRASMPAPIEYYRAIARRPTRTPKITVPTLHLHGEQDGCVGPELGDGEERWFAGRFERQVLGGVGHFLHMERPDLVASRIMEWMQGTARVTGA